MVIRSSLFAGFNHLKNNYLSISGCLWEFKNQQKIDIPEEAIRFQNIADLTDFDFFQLSSNL